MALSEVSTRNNLADRWASLGTTYSLHNGDPGAGGTANELSGDGYARQNTTWGAAANGTVTGSQLVFTVGTVNATWACRWNGATLLDRIDITDVSVSPSGEIRFTPTYTQS